MFFFFFFFFFPPPFHFVYPVEKGSEKNTTTWHKTLSASAISKQVCRCCINLPQELTCQSIVYIDLARAKSEALVSVIYIVYSYKIENRVMLKQLCTCGTLFLYISLPLFCTTTRRNSINFLVTRFRCSCSLFFFAAAYFHLGGR